MVEGAYKYVIFLDSPFYFLFLLLTPCFFMVQEKWDYISDTFSGTLLTYFVSTTVSPVHSTPYFQRAHIHMPLSLHCKFS